MSNARNLYLHLTDKCNLFCMHCYCGKKLKKQRQMSLEEAENAIKLFKKEFDVITLTGGEAVLSPIFYDIVKILNREKLYIRLDTNGQDLDEFFSKITPEQIQEIRFSIDGSTPKINDLIRQKKGAYEKAKRNIKKAVEKEFFVEITATITKQNYKDVKNIITLSKELGADIMNFHLVTVNGNSKQNDVELHPREWLKVIEEQIKTSKGIKIKYPQRFSCKLIPEGYCGCAGLKNSRLSVFSGGQAFNCALYFDTLKNARMINEREIQFNEKDTEIKDFKIINQNKGICQRFYDITTFQKEELDKEGIVPLCIYYKKIINE